LLFVERRGPYNAARAAFLDMKRKRFGGICKRLVERVAGADAARRIGKIDAVFGAFFFADQGDLVIRDLHPPWCSQRGGHSNSA
jgi:hypothetical protein